MHSSCCGNPCIRRLSGLNSLSALSITGRWICFRVQTQSLPTHGSFQMEVVSSVMPRSSFFGDAFSENSELFKSSECIIMCTCCKNIISNMISFKRMLPFPDIDYDPSEWFCCKHDASSVQANISPRHMDLFYGPCFAILHSGLFNDNLRVDRDVILCTRCLQHVGKVHGSDSNKLWNCCVEYNFPERSWTRPATDPLDDFLVAIKASSTGILGEEIILQSFVNHENHYLSIKLMDWHLNLITEPMIVVSDCEISLEKASVVKVLYKYETSRGGICGDSPNIKYCEVSLSVIETGLKHLLSSTKRFPEIYRAAEDYYIGHIHLTRPTTNSA